MYSSPKSDSSAGLVALIMVVLLFGAFIWLNTLEEADKCPSGTEAHIVKNYFDLPTVLCTPSTE